MTALEAFSEAKRLKVSVDEGVILGVIGKLSSGQASEIRAQIKGKSSSSLSGQLRILKKKGMIESVTATKWDWPSYRLTAKAKAWKGEG